MLDALRYLRAAAGEFYFDLPRMIVVNLLWFLFSLPFIFIIFAFASNSEVRSLSVMAPYLVWGVPFIAVALLLAGPATAGVYYTTNRMAHGELFEFRGFWVGFRRFLVRGWLLGLADVGAGALLVLNIWFYWYLDRPGVWILSIIFGYLLVMWFAVQGYLFALLVEMDQGVVLVVRNAFFLAMDNLGLTLGLFFVNAFLLAISIPLGALLLPLGTMVLTSGVNNKAVVDAVDRYRASGRIIQGTAA